MKTPSFYAIIPASVRYDHNLKANEKLLYGELTALSEKEGYCWATNKYFAELYNVDDKTVSSWISNLEKSGHVQVSGKTTQRKIHIVKHWSGKPDQSSQEKTTSTGQEKLTHSNTSIITTRYLTASASQSAGSEEKEITYEPNEDLTPTKDLKNRFGAKVKGYDTSLTNQLVEWAVREKRNGFKFGSPVVQKTAISRMLSTGRTVDDIKKKWSDMEADPFWSEKGFDFTKVARQFDLSKNFTSKPIARHVSDINRL